MPATPNDKVTLAGSGALMHVLNPDGLPVPVPGDADGNVSIALAASGSAVKQGDGDATKPWYAQGVNAGVPERLATQNTLAVIEKIGRVADSLTFTEHTITNASQALPDLTTPYGFEIQVPDSATGPVFVRPINPVTVSGAGRGWEIPVGTSRFFNAPNTTGWFGISTAASVEVLIVQEVKA